MSKKRASEAVAAQTGNKYYAVGGFQAFLAYWKNYVNFTGRTSRREFWWNTLFQTIIAVVLWLASFGAILSTILKSPEKFASGISDGQMMSMIGSFLGVIILWIVIGLATVLPSWAIAVRRFRDAGVHWGFFVALQLLTVVAGIVNLRDDTLGSVMTLIVAVIILVIEVLPTKNPPVEEITEEITE